MSKAIVFIANNYHMEWLEAAADIIAACLFSTHCGRPRVVHHVLMFEVTAIRRRLLSQVVELKATDEMTGTKTLLAGVRTVAGCCPYHFPVGAEITLKFAPWRRFRVGDRVDASTVLRHPAVQETIWRNDTKWL